MLLNGIELVNNVKIWTVKKQVSICWTVSGLVEKELVNWAFRISLKFVKLVSLDCYSLFK